ncbi:MAG: NAD(P)-dependent oxidoreductase [Lachnospiraceae bacterium]|nr:NAD(P)-dependent oxidoreductase [Lachnospiraceae bacterium]
MKVVITGPTGAIGHALIEECLANGDEVLAICHKGSRRVDTLPKSENLKLLSLDLGDYGIAAESIAEEKYDVFFHFAWEGTTGADRNDVGLQEKNVKSALDSVRLAKALGCNTYIGAGSQAEYGRVEGKLAADTPVNPENEYGKAKLKAGNRTRELCRGIGMKHIWTRVLSVYGPYDGEKSMIISALRKMIAGEDVSFTKGEQKWDYLYSEDAGRAFRLLSQKGMDGKIYVIGSGKVRELREYIQVMTNGVKFEKRVGLGDIPYAEKQVMHLEADISELTKDTGFVPQVGFEEGIERTIVYVRSTMR